MSDPAADRSRQRPWSPTPSPESAGRTASALSRRAAVPELVLDCLNLVLGQSEEVAGFMDQRQTYLLEHFVLRIAGLLDGALKQGDAIRQRVAVGPGPFGERCALIQPEQAAFGTVAHLLFESGRRPILDDDLHVLHAI